MKVSLTFIILLIIQLSYGQVTNLNAGVWSSQVLWSDNKIPTDTTNIILNYNIIADVNGYCKSLNTNGHSVVVNSGIHLNIGIPQTHSGVIYTNVEPDTVMTSTHTDCCSFYNLDLDNDGVGEFGFTLLSDGFVQCGGASCITQHGIYKLTINASGSNMVLDSLVGSTYQVTPLNANEDISHASVSWNPGSSYILQVAGNTCCNSIGWINTGIIDKYIGLALVNGTNTYYGWLRIRIWALNTHTSFTIEEYAYNATPNQPILAGQTQ